MITSLQSAAAFLRPPLAMPVHADADCLPESKVDRDLRQLARRWHAV